MDIRLAVPGIIGLVVFIIIFNVYHIIKIRKTHAQDRRRQRIPGQLQKEYSKCKKKAGTDKAGRLCQVHHKV